MQIFIKTLIKGRILTLDLNHNTTIEEVKNKLFDIEGIPVKLQRLYYGNIILNNYRYLSDYNISNIYFVYHLFLPFLFLDNMIQYF